MIINLLFGIGHKEKGFKNNEKDFNYKVNLIILLFKSSSEVQIIIINI